MNSSVASDSTPTSRQPGLTRNKAPTPGNTTSSPAGRIRRRCSPGHQDQELPVPRSSTSLRGQLHHVSRPATGNDGLSWCKNRTQSVRQQSTCHKRQHMPPAVSRRPQPAGRRRMIAVLIRQRDADRDRSSALNRDWTVALTDDSVRQVELMRRHRRVPPPRSSIAGFRVPREVIVLLVRWYLRYGLSFRDV